MLSAGRGGSEGFARQCEAMALQGVDARRGFLGSPLASWASKAAPAPGEDRVELSSFSVLDFAAFADNADAMERCLSAGDGEHWGALNLSVAARVAAAHGSTKALAALAKFPAIASGCFARLGSPTRIDLAKSLAGLDTLSTPERAEASKALALAGGEAAKAAFEESGHWGAALAGSSWLGCAPRPALALWWAPIHGMRTDPQAWGLAMGMARAAAVLGASWRLEREAAEILDAPGPASGRPPQPLFMAAVLALCAVQAIGAPARSGRARAARNKAAKAAMRPWALESAGFPMGFSRQVGVAAERGQIEAASLAAREKSPARARL